MVKRSLLIASIRSNDGKTIITTSLIKELVKRNVKLITYKVGPDYIDTIYHKHAGSEATYNLDGILHGSDYIKDIFLYTSSHVDVSLIEGTMGIFDKTDDSLSSYNIATILSTKVLLIVDAINTFNSIAPILNGILSEDKYKLIDTIIINNIRSRRHKELIEASIKQHSYRNIDFFYLYKEKETLLHESYLGLSTVKINYLKVLSNDVVSKLIDRFLLSNKYLINIDKIDNKINNIITKITPLKKEINVGLFTNGGFDFIYKENINLLLLSGFNIIRIDPINDSNLNSKLDVLLIFGGFPEKYIEALSENRSFLRSIQQFKGMIYAECGGLLYLLKRFNGYKMANLIDGYGYMSRKLTLRYVDIKSTIFQTNLKGHEYHYSYIDYSHKARLNHLWNINGELEGYKSKNIYASYIHISWWRYIEDILNLIKNYEKRNITSWSK